MNYINLKRNSLVGLNNPLWNFIDTGIHDGSFNMSYDNFLLDSFVSGLNTLPVLRVYGWSEKTISTGVNQVLSLDDKNLNSGLPIIKRITGGQAVLHELKENELTYSVCLSFKGKLNTLYYEIGQVLIYFLKKYGLNASFGYSHNNYLSNFNCFESQTPADIVVNDKKVVGNAQCRKKNYVLQHGSIKLDIIRKLSGENVTFSQAVVDLKSSFQEKLNVNLYAADKLRLPFVAPFPRSDLPDKPTNPILA